MAALARPLPGTAATDSPRAPAGDTASARAEAATADVARRAAAALTARDAKAFDALVDTEALLAVATAGLPGPADVRAAFAASVRGAAVGDGLVAALGENGSYRFLGVVPRESGACALARFSGLDGMNFHELFVAGEGPAARLVDLYDYSTGERLTETIRSAWLAHLSQVPGAAERLPPGPERSLLEQWSRQGQLAALAGRGAWDDLLLAWSALPEDLRWQRRFARLRLDAAWNLGRERFQPVLDEHRARFPDDTSVDIRLVAAGMSGGLAADAFTALDRLERRVGPDAGLDLARAAIAERAGDHPAAVKHARRATETEPDLVEAWWTLLWAALAAHDFEETTRTLLAVEARTKTTFGDLTAMSRFSHYVESPEYQRYLEARAGTRK